MFTVIKAIPFATEKSIVILAQPLLQKKPEKLITIVLIIS
jgi:hypothetical protein